MLNVFRQDPPIRPPKIFPTKKEVKSSKILNHIWSSLGAPVLEDVKINSANQNPENSEEVPRITKRNPKYPTNLEPNQPNRSDWRKS